MHKLVLLLLVFSMASCVRNKAVLNEHHTFESANWDLNQEVMFHYENLDTINNRRLYLNLRNNENYPFSNLYLVTTLTAPSGQQSVDTLEYLMTDKFGKWLGVGVSNVKQNKLVYKEPYVFREKGKYRFNIKHAMRKRDEVIGVEKLQGVVSLGILIE